jgi:hypothetical protein
MATGPVSPKDSFYGGGDDLWISAAFDLDTVKLLMSIFVRPFIDSVYANSCLLSGRTQTRTGPSDSMRFIIPTSTLSDVHLVISSSLVSGNTSRSVGFMPNTVCIDHLGL